jgi:fatty-acid desaturase
MKMNKATIGYLLLLHIGALAAPFFFSWSALAIFVILSVISGMSVTLGFHRLLTHRSFDCAPWLRRLLAFMGGLAGEGGVIQWVADHRAHHQHTDKPGDPHSPRDGFWWSHVTWTFPWPGNEARFAYQKRYCPDLIADPVMVLIDENFIYFHFVLAAMLFGLGGFPWLVWGVFLRLVFVLHSTWMVNSVSHKWGYRNHETDDDSRNNPLVAALTYGEGHHNNHHAFPTAANHGHLWFELDLTHWLICLLERVGLVWSVKRHANDT